MSDLFVAYNWQKGRKNGSGQCVITNQHEPSTWEDILHLTEVVASEQENMADDIIIMNWKVMTDKNTLIITREELEAMREPEFEIVSNGTMIKFNMKEHNALIDKLLEKMKSCK